MKLRLFHKFFIAFLMIGAAGLAVLGPLIAGKLKAEFTQRIEDEMVSAARIVALVPAGGIAGRVGALAAHARARVTLIDASGGVVADSGGVPGERDNHLNRSELQEARLRGKGSAVRYSQTLKQEMFYVAVPIREGSRTTGYVRLARPLAEITGAVDGMGRSISGIALATVASLLMIALLFSLKVLSPIGRLAAFTGKVSRGHVSGALRIESRDEIGELAENINHMAATLQEKIGRADTERRKLASLFSGMSEGVTVLDADNRIESVNRGMEEMTGRRPGEMVGRTILDAFRNVELQDLLERFLRNEATVCGEVDLGDDRPATMDVTISAVEGGADGERKTMLVFHDVTRLKKLERIRTDFVANVTHEIRTPLTAIIGFTETLQQGAFENPETARKFLRTIRENAERLNRLVDDLLTLSGLELGEVNLHPEGLRIEEAIDQVLAIVASRVSEKGLTIRKEIPGGLPLIRADRDRLVQIFLNILDNAVKFTPPGGSIAFTASPGDGGFLTVRIADTGIGIPKGEIPRLGERFYRADKTRSREMGGTGLGLSIVKHLMKASQGRIGIDSTLGHGTTVSLHFPIFLDSE
jgi:two-component system phosphate regulon sensor histidine kinase PhoR